MGEGSVNIADRFTATARRLRDRVAVCVPIRDDPARYRRYTFAELMTAADKIAAGLAERGIGRGTRTLLAVRPGFELIAVTIGLFKVGAVPVLIDPGMGKKNLIDCIARSRPTAMIAVGRAFLARAIYRKAFATVTTTVTVGRRWFWGGSTLAGLLERPAADFPTVPTAADDMAAILFTTGATGPPKGVVYTHRIFDAQCDLIRDHYGVTDDDVDLPAFPLFALFSVALGMRVVIPVIDTTAPASVDPRKIVDAVNGERVTFTFGSPAIWKKVSAWCVDRDIKLPSLKRVLMAGAPVANEIHERLIEDVLPPDGVTHTPFGATEALPIADITGHEVLAETAKLTAAGKGVCVGRPLPGFTFRIVAIADEPSAPIVDAPPGEIGEIMVTGPTVTPGYFEQPEQDALHLVRESDGRLWRKMGDVGYLDGKGRLWFCGRKGHRVVTPKGTLFTIPTEAIFNTHRSVARTALVGLGGAPNQRPALLVELDPASANRDRAKVAAELFAIGAVWSHTAGIDAILFHPAFPTDIRHNAKIFREELAVWAAERVSDIIVKTPGEGR